MAQAGYTPIQLYYSTTAAAVPLAANLAAGELAINIVDGKLYYENNSGVVTLLASAAGASGDVVGPASATDNAVARFDGTTGKLIQNGVVIIGDTGAVTGVTDLTASGSVTLSGGTANGVAYLNGSKVVTSGSALTFDGTSLGVGTASPASKLTIGGSGANRISFGAPAGTQFVGYDGTTDILQIASYNDIRFQVNAYNEGMRLTSTGLGIGTSSPQSTYKLTISGTDSVFPAVYLDNTTNSKAYSMRVTGTSWIIRDNTAGTDRLNIDTSGNVGIGTSSPATKLNLYGSNVAGVGQLKIDCPSGDFSQLTLFVNNVSQGFIRTNASALDIGTSSSTPFTFHTNGNERMRLDTSGNLLVGTTTATGKLTVNGAISSIVADFNETSGVPYIRVQNGTQVSGLGVTASTGWVGTISNHVVEFRTNNTERARIDSSGNLLVGCTNNNGGLVQLQAAGSNSAGSGQQLTFRLADNGAYAGLRLSTGGALCTDVYGSGWIEATRVTSGGYFKASNTGVYNDATGAYHEFRGSSANSYVVIIGCTNATPLSEYIQDWRFTAASPNDGNARFWNCEDSTANRAYMRSNGGLSNYQANDTNLSDRREKTNFAPAKSYLETICAIPVQTFNYIDQNMEDDGGLTLGVVAQDVQAVAPELVTENNWGSKEDPKMRLSIYQTDLQYALMKCIQEQQAIIESLKARLDAANL